MANRTAKIYERLKVDGRWIDRPVQLPKLRPDDTLDPKDDRDGHFYVTWYDGRKKRRHPEALKRLAAAVEILVAKEFYLRNRKRAGVTDSTVPVLRLPIRASSEEYIAGLSGAPATKKEHRYAVRLFVKWNAEVCDYQFRKRFVDEIDKAQLMRFMDYLVDDEPENTPYTAAWKLLRVNKWVKTVLKLDHGKGPIKKSDLRRELESNAVAEINTAEELVTLFAAMAEREFIIYETFLKTGLRKKELMFLDDDDLQIELRSDGKDKREIRVARKNEYGFMPKNGKSRTVPIPRDLAERLLAWKARKRPSKLLFSTRTGAPDLHLLEKLRSIAKRAGLDPGRFWLHKLRADYAVGRLRAGVDVDTLREWLGHKDGESLKAYLVHLNNEEAIASGKVDAGHISLPSAVAHSRMDQALPQARSEPLSNLGEV